MLRSFDCASSHWRTCEDILNVKLEPVIGGSGFDHFTGDPRQIRVNGAMVHSWLPNHDPRLHFLAHGARRAVHGPVKRSLVMPSTARPWR